MARKNLFFSSTAQVSHGFTGHPAGAATTVRCMFLANVCCGKQSSNGGAAIPVGYDSSLCTSQQQLVISDPTRAYPKYLIVYTV